MKKLIAAVLIAVFFAGSAFATDANKINVRIRTNFDADFNKASEVTWTVRKDFVKASFTSEGENMQAFYNYEGSLIGTSRDLTVEALPKKAKKLLSDKYAGYAVKEVILFSNKDEDAYYVSAENDKHKIILKVKDHSSVSLVTREKK
jgi:opacity protein-like surface antigen